MGSIGNDDSGQPYRECPDQNGKFAIVGMSVRLAGKINSPEEFWNFLIQKKNGSTEVPSSRYNIDAFHDPVQEHAVKPRRGYFLQDEYLETADLSFFRMSPHEAAESDPQQLLLLELVWECMENAGQVNWRGKNIGCFVGSFGEDWLDLYSKDTLRSDRCYPLGTGDFALSNRVSYEYDLKGPSVTFRTACSSSLVALHSACQAISAGDCSGAIVCGSSLIFTPTMSAAMSDNMILSPDGQCKSFDATANGFARGEGIAVIYIKPLSTASKCEDPIRAVIRSTATNCDGATANITFPSQDRQEEIIREAYRRAQIDNIAETGFVECHGTGTVAGDTVETRAIAKAFNGEGVIIGAVSLSPYQQWTPEFDTESIIGQTECRPH